MKALYSNCNIYVSILNVIWNERFSWSTYFACYDSYWPVEWKTNAFLSLSFSLSFFLPNTKRKKTQNNQIQRITACSIQQATHSKNCGFFGKLWWKNFFLFLEKKNVRFALFLLLTVGSMVRKAFFNRVEDDEQNVRNV